MPTRAVLDAKISDLGAARVFEPGSVHINLYSIPGLQFGGSWTAKSLFVWTYRRGSAG
jgi:hypothetical protein